ncbi:MAG: cytochrome c [Saprospiraceae bacterium]|nr:cytochrome c [Candidatus Vicinibacter affinis]
MEKGKANYDIYCSICHGAKGDGAGYLVRDDGGVYPAQPANFLKDEFIASNEGRYYHSIMYGLNVMGGYSDKLSYEERWEVIHYIRSLQAASKNLKYSESENTFTGSQAIADAKKAAATVSNTAASVVAPKK